MTLLIIYPANNPKKADKYNETEDIKKKLKEINIDFERWHSPQTINSDSSQEEILKAYEKDVKKIMQKHNFKGVDVISMQPGRLASPEKLRELREKFLSEHIHSDDEVRYFIEGQGLFCIHANDQVYSLLCTADDFISVPKNTKHWFDMGSEPHFRCIRFFEEESGWIAQYTGDDIANKFPCLS